MNNKLSDSMRASLIRGALFIAPLWLSIVVLGFAYNMIESAFGGISAQVVRWVLPAEWLTGSFAGGHIPGFSVLLALLLLFILGAIATWRFGRFGLGLFDKLLLSLPVLRSIYSAARKLFDAFGEQNGGKSRFQKVVFVDWTPGCKTLGFVTNEIAPAHENDVRRYVVYVPMMPNPTSGVVLVVPVSSVIESEMHVEEALKFGLSLGVLTPPAVQWDKL